MSRSGRGIGRGTWGVLLLLVLAVSVLCVYVGVVEWLGF